MLKMKILERMDYSMKTTFSGFLKNAYGKKITQSIWQPTGMYMKVPDAHRLNELFYDCDLGWVMKQKREEGAMDKLLFENQLAIEKALWGKH